MKTTLVSKENNIAKFTMDITKEEFDNAVIEAYKATKDQYPVDGFRKGKAPRKVIEAHYGQEIFYDEAINRLLSEYYPVALDELKLEVINRPSMEFPEMTDDGFTITVNVECYPEVEIKDYKGVEIEKVEHEVTEEMLNNELENIRKRNARMNPVERPAKEGDIVVIDYKGFKGEEQFEGGTAEKYPLRLGSNTFIPGFEDQLIGVAAGEEKDVNLTFPKEYPAEDLAGAEVVFKCKVHEVKEEELPELNDDFAKDVSEFDTLEEYKKDVNENLIKANTARAENEMKSAAVKAVCEKNDIDVPDAMVDEEIDARIKDFDQQLKYQGYGLEKYLEMAQKEVKDLKDEIRDECAKAVKTRMVLRGIAEAEKIEATEEDIKKELELMAAQYGMDAEQFRNMIGAEHLSVIGKDVEMGKAIDIIYDNAVIK